MKRNLLSLCLTLALCLSLLPGAALAVDPGSYVALGDSITTGYAPVGVNSNGKVDSPFADQVAQKEGYTLTNLAADGETSASLLRKLQDSSNPELVAAVAGADLITITLGGNDLMYALYDYLAAEYHQEGFDGADAQQALMNADLPFLAFVAEQLPSFAGSGQAVEALATFSGNLGQIVAAIKGANPDVSLLVATQYNPYSGLASRYGDLVPQARIISDGVDAGVKALNSVITAAGQAGGFTVVDVYTAFERAVAEGQNPCNPSYTAAVGLSLDFHPNQVGHDRIAAAMEAALGNTEQPLTFSDVAETAWYADAVYYVSQHDLMSGTSTTAFGPEVTTSRAMIVTVLWRMAGSPVVNYAMHYTDVDPGAWYGEAIRWAASQGVVTGYGDGRFGTNDPITREQFAAMLWRFAQQEGYDVSIGENTNILSYTDVTELSEYAIPAVQWAVGAGIIHGTGNSSTLTPQGGATRAQTAVMLMQFCEKYVLW